MPYSDLLREQRIRGKPVTVTPFPRTWHAGSPPHARDERG